MTQFKVGQRVRVTVEGTVADYDIGTPGCITGSILTETGRAIFRTADATIEVIPDPLPEEPTAFGSLVRVTPKSGQAPFLASRVDHDDVPWVAQDHECSWDWQSWGQIARDALSVEILFVPSSEG